MKIDKWNYHKYVGMRSRKNLRTSCKRFIFILRLDVYLILDGLNDNSCFIVKHMILQKWANR